MKPAVKIIYIFSNDQARIDLIESRVKNALDGNEGFKIAGRAISYSYELQNIFDQFGLENYYIIDFDIIHRDKLIENLLAGKEFNICIFSRNFDKEIALYAIERGYNQYFCCDDLSRADRIINEIIRDNAIKGFNYSRLIYTFIESVDILGILNLVIDSSVNISNSNFGFSILKKNIEEIYEPPVIYFAKNIESSVLSELDEFILSFKRYLVTSDAYFLNQSEAKKLCEKIEISEEYSFLIIKLHISDLFVALLVLAKSSNYNDEDVHSLNRMLTLYRAFFKNYERYELAKQLSYVDDLTTVYNRRYLERFINKLIASSKERKSCFSIIFLDIDNLKEVNDKYGHLTGSKVIKRISEILKLSVRGFDKVFRFGGDEFAIILPLTDTEGSLFVAERIRITIQKQPIKFDNIDEDLGISVTMGIATYPEHGSTSAELIANSDKAMYIAKQRGKNRIEKFINTNKEII